MNDDHAAVLPALRISQLDSAELDCEIFNVTKSQFSKMFKYFKSNFLSKFEPELDAGLKFLIWKYTVLVNGSTLGQDMLSLKYTSLTSGSGAPVLSRLQKNLYALILIGCPWIKERLTDLLRLVKLENFISHVNKCVSWFENGLKVCTLMNFLIFLQQGVFRSLFERILGIKAVFPQQQHIRQVSFEFLTRELLWHGFSEFLFFVLPLINYQWLRNFMLRRFSSKTDIQVTRIKADFISCAVCGDWPTAPREMRCKHIFCYYCLMSNYKADPSFSCPLCGLSISDVSCVKPVLININDDHR